MAERKPLDFTASEFGWTLAAMALLGAIAGWGLFGAPPFFATALHNSNWADWIAAAGTWVIGISAVKYSRDAHRLRLRELDEVANRQARDRNAARNDLFRRLMPVYGATFEIEYLGKKRDELTVGMVNTAAQDFFSDISQYHLSEGDKSILTVSISSMLAEAEGYMSDLKSSVSRYENFLKGLDDDDVLDGSDIGFIDYDIKQVEKLSGCLDEIRDELLASMEDVVEIRKRRS